jgi:hypothetical protein
MSFAEAIIREWRIATLGTRRQQADVGEISEDEIERQLAEEGLIRVPRVDQQPMGDFKRIDVGGKPMSEMIIEERR